MSELSKSMRLLFIESIIISKILFKTQQSITLSTFSRFFKTDKIVIFYRQECFIFRTNSLIKLNHMYFVQIFICFFFKFNFICFNGFLTAGGEAFSYPYSISRVVKGKVLHFVNKVSSFTQAGF